MPSARNWRSNDGEALLLRKAQARGRFVQQQQTRAEAEGAGDLHHALLAQRQIAGRPIEHMRQGQVAVPERAHGRAARFPPRDRGATWRAHAGAAGEMRAEGDVLQHAAAARRRTCWKLRATPSAAMRCGDSCAAGAPNRRTVPALGGQHAADMIEQRRLARPVRTDERDDFAGVDSEADIANCSEAAEVARHGIDGEQYVAWMQTNAR